MDHESPAARGGNRRDKAIESGLAVLVVDANPALDGDRHTHCGLHGGDAVSHKVGFGHQAGAETALLHPVRRAADVKIDLGIAEILATARRIGQEARIAAAKLQAPPGLRADRSQAGAGGRHGAPPGRSPSRCKAARARRAGDGRSGNAGPSSPSWARHKICARRFALPWSSYLALSWARIAYTRKRPFDRAL